MRPDDRKKANEDTLAELRRLQAAVQEVTAKRKDELQKRASRTFRDLTWMILVTFLFGLVLVTASLLLFVFSDRSLSVLGLGTLGVADWLALFFYKPMDRLQKADKDYAQQIIILKSWALSVNLEMVAMNANDSESVRIASKNIRTAGLSAAHALQDFLEAPSQSTAAPAKANAGSQTAPA